MAITPITPEITEHVEKQAYAVSRQSVGRLCERLGVNDSYENQMIVRSWLCEPIPLSEMNADDREERISGQ